MRNFLGLALVLGSASVASAQGIIDFEGSGGTASFNGSVFSGSAIIDSLNAFGTGHDGLTAVHNGVLNFMSGSGPGPGGSFTLTGSFGMIPTETIYSGTFVGTPSLTGGGAGAFTFFNAIGSGTLASNVAAYFNVRPNNAMGAFALTVDAPFGTTFYSHKLVTSTDVTIKPVPEPSSFLLCGIPAALFVRKRLRRRAA